jgi:ribonuclease J
MSVHVIPLGGLGEIGMNCLVVAQGDRAMVIDCGITFDDRGLGVDVVHPDFRALDAWRDRIAGVFLTHGHEDHIGALPYFLRRFDVPVWGPPYALGLVRTRLSEHEILEHARLIPTEPRRTYEVGPFTVEPIRVTHSIADATALAIRTEAGTVLHSGDFKFDDAPTDGQAFDVARIEELGREGVALLLSDSTNVFNEGSAGSEAAVGEVLEPIVEGANGAVVVAIFASNVHRLRLLGDIARATRRKIVLLGRSVGTHTRVAHDTGYLDWPSDLVWPAERARELPRRAILGIATGTQGEAAAALARLSRGDHPALDLARGDTVVLSSRIIPGREPEVFAIFGDLVRRGIELRTWATDRGVHVSGHACRAEQRRMIELARPRAFVPLHGTMHHLVIHAELARGLGVPSVEVLENGDVAEVSAQGIRKIDRVVSGRVHTFASRPIPAEVLREREVLAQGGIVVCAVAVDARLAVREVWLSTRGVVVEESEPELFAAARRDVAQALGALPPNPPPDDAFVAETARLAVRRAFARVVGYKPMTVVKVTRHQGTP